MTLISNRSFVTKTGRPMPQDIDILKILGKYILIQIIKTDISWAKLLHAFLDWAVHCIYTESPHYPKQVQCFPCLSNTLFRRLRCLLAIVGFHSTLLANLSNYPCVTHTPRKAVPSYPTPLVNTTLQEPQLLI